MSPTLTFYEHSLPQRSYQLLHPWPNYNFFFWCKHCGETWARADAGLGNQWVSHMIPCIHCSEQHKSALQVAGSIWLDKTPGYLEALPQELLQREYELINQHIKQHGAF